MAQSTSGTSGVNLRKRTAFQLANNKLKDKRAKVKVSTVGAKSKHDDDDDDDVKTRAAHRNPHKGKGIMSQSTSGVNLRKRTAFQLANKESQGKSTEAEVSTVVSTVSKHAGDDCDDDEVTTQAAHKDTDREWSCGMCTLINEPFSKECAACGFINEKLKNESSLQFRSYEILLELEKYNVIQNTEMFECSICFTQCIPGDGIVLRNCLHTFCRQCLAQTVEFSDDFEVKCPFIDENYTCPFALEDREIKQIVSAEVFEKRLAKSLAITENAMPNAFHCKKANCSGWCIIDNDDGDHNINMIFNCPICFSNNCIPCQAIHSGKNCKEYQEYLVVQAETDPTAKKTLTYFMNMKKRKCAMNCPKCNIILMKTDGCDWLQCVMCKTHICWATLGPRWGPNGVGDKSGGCGCDFSHGKPCVPHCKNCH